VLWFRRKRTNDCTDVKRIAEKPDLRGSEVASKFPDRTDMTKGKQKDELLKSAKCQLGKFNKKL